MTLTPTLSQKERESRPKRAVSVALIAATLLTVASARAATLDRVRAAGALHCGAAARAGFADPAEDGRVTGLGVDLCRALAIAILGPAGGMEFRVYASPQDYDAVRRSQDDVSFLTADVVQEQALAAGLVPGPTVFVAEQSALAQPGVTSLAGRTVCFINGSPAHQALEAWAAHTATPIIRSGYQEDGEMHDAFDARRCDAMAGEATELADIRAASPARAGSRILPPMAVVPVFAATATADGAWAGLVGWAMGAIVQSETAPSPWRADLPGVAAPGLRDGWQRDAAAALGSYGDMTRRAMGGASLPAGPNALWPAGVLLPAGPR